jgi:branched-chain amino acid transport system permease protein
VEIAFQYADTILVFAVFALSLNLLQGYTGQVSVAHAAFGAIGGYTVALLFLDAGVGPAWGLALGTLGGGIAGFLVGLPALRLTTEWLILLTLAVQTIIITLVQTDHALGGSFGLQNVAGLRIFGLPLDEPSQMFPLFLILTVIVYVACFRMGESPYGRVLRGIRDDATACRSLGKPVYTYKLTVFSLTAAMAGLAGGMLVIESSIASPTLFSFDQSAVIVAMVVVGGAGNLNGSLIGVIALTLLAPLFDRLVPFSEQAAFVLRLVAYGAVLVAVLLVRPEGLYPDQITRRLMRALRRGGAAAEVGAKDAVPAPSSTVESVRQRQPRDAPSEVVVSAEGLCKKFGGIVAADDLSFRLFRGQISALVGPNGAGKTTVFNLLSGAVKPDAGRVFLRGEDVTDATPDRVARLGMVRSFQSVRIFPRLSALENVMLAVAPQMGERLVPLFTRWRGTRAHERAARASARNWLHFVGMSAHEDAPAGALAFGQQKLVALARVLATDAEVLLLDEPASGIDRAWVEAMLEVIASLRDAGRTICIVEHNLHVVERLAQHTYFMELGKITAEGNFSELTADRRLAEAYFGVV